MMKKTWGLALILAVILSTTFAKEKKCLSTELNTEIKQVIPLTDLTPDMTRELLAGKHPDIAVECKEGTELPLAFLGNYEVFSISCFPNLKFKMEQTCYFRFIKNKTYMSFNLKRWKKPSEFKGNLETNCGASEDKSHVLIEQTLR